MEPLIANACMGWLCVGQPIAAYLLGAYFTRSGGFRSGLTRLLIRLAGPDSLPGPEV